MIFKIAGSVMIVYGTGLYGFLKAMRPHKRYKGLLKIDTALGVMENEINFSNALIDDVLINAAKASGTSEIFTTCAEASGDLPVSTRWREAVLKDKDRLCLTNEDCQTIIMLSGELGMTDRVGQIKNIRHVREIIKGHINEAYEEYMKESKMLKGLGIGIGLFLVILLL